MDAAKGIQQLPTRVDLNCTKIVLLTAIKESNQTHRVQSTASIHEQDESPSEATGSQSNESIAHLGGNSPSERHVLPHNVQAPSANQR